MFEDFIVRMPDIRSALMCSSGARLFFSQYKLDWNKFLKEGISANELEATGDAMALKLLSHMRAKNGRR